METQEDILKRLKYLTKRHYLGEAPLAKREFLDSWDHYQLNENEKSIDSHIELLHKLRYVAINFTKLDEEGKPYYPWRADWVTHPWKWYAKSSEPSNTEYMRGLRYSLRAYTDAGWPHAHMAAILAKAKIRSVWLPATRKARRKHKIQEKTYLAGLDYVLAPKNPDVTVFANLPMHLRRYLSEFL